MTSIADIKPNLQGQEIQFDEHDLLLKTPFKLLIS